MPSIVLYRGAGGLSQCFQGMELGVVRDARGWGTPTSGISLNKKERPQTGATLLKGAFLTPPPAFPMGTLSPTRAHLPHSPTGRRWGADNAPRGPATQMGASPPRGTAPPPPQAASAVPTPSPAGAPPTTRTAPNRTPSRPGAPHPGHRPGAQGRACPPRRPANTVSEVRGQRSGPSLAPALPDAESERAGVREKAGSPAAPGKASHWPRPRPARAPRFRLTQARAADAAVRAAVRRRGRGRRRRLAGRPAQPWAARRGRGDGAREGRGHAPGPGHGRRRC